MFKDKPLLGEPYSGGWPHTHAKWAEVIRLSGLHKSYIKKKTLTSEENVCVGGSSVGGHGGEYDQINCVHL